MLEAMGRFDEMAACSGVDHRLLDCLLYCVIVCALFCLMGSSVGHACIPTAGQVRCNNQLGGGKGRNSLWLGWRRGPSSYQVRETLTYFIDFNRTWSPLLSSPCLLAPSGFLSLLGVCLIVGRTLCLVGFKFPTFSFGFAVTTFAVFALGRLVLRLGRYVGWLCLSCVVGL